MLHVQGLLGHISKAPNMSRTLIQDSPAAGADRDPPPLDPAEIVGPVGAKTYII